jgi:prevent-host-death family protein
MRRPSLVEDIKPVSEFRANAAKLIDRVRETGRPLVLTQRGHSAAVVLDVEEYEHLLEEVELLKDIQLAEKQLQSGKGVSNRKAKEELRRRLAR